MTQRHIAIVTGVSVLLLTLLAWQYFPAHANYSVTTEDPNLNISQQAVSTNRIFLPLVLKNYTAPAPLWRFGVAQVRRELTSYDSYSMVSMRFGWYADFQATDGASLPYGMEYVPLLRVKQWKLQNDGTTWTQCRAAVQADNYDPHYVTPLGVTPYAYTVSMTQSQIQAMAINRPGMTWVVGNEIERQDWLDSGGNCNRQDEMLPEAYAQAYHDIYLTIKNVDPTAQVAIGGLIEFTDLRRQYLDRVWNEYLTRYGTTMPVDVWNIHVYVLQEVKGSWGADIPAGFSQTSEAIYTIEDNKDFNKAWQMVVNLRTWMNQHGERNKPLITNEYGVNMPPDYPGFSAPEVRDSYLYPSFNNFLNTTNADTGYPADGNRLMQRWNWWSLDYDDGDCDGSSYLQFFGGALFNSGLGPSGGGTCAYPAKGIAALGTYWSQYVAALPAGSAKPYASVQSPALSLAQTTLPALPTYMPASPDCPASQRVRLQFQEPALSGFSTEGLDSRYFPRASRAPVTQEMTICLPPK